MYCTTDNGYNRDAADLDYTINSLQLNATDVIEMHRAYLNDDTEYASVPMKLIYRIIALNDATDIPSDVAKKVEAWRDTMFFAETLQDTEFPILYAPAAMQLLLWPDSTEDDTDLSKLLVTVIPDMAQVRITTPEAIVAEDEMEQGHYMNHDLKMDVLMMAHNCAHHPSIAQTTRNVAALAWFPSIKTYTAEYFDSCSICQPRRKAHRSVGISIMGVRRVKAIQADFVILDNGVAQKTDMTAILTLICMASRMAMYVPVRSIDTINAA